MAFYLECKTAWLKLWHCAGENVARNDRWHEKLAAWFCHLKEEIWMCSVANWDNTSEWNFSPYNVISISPCPLRSVNLCLPMPGEGKLNLLLYLFPLLRRSISNSEPPKHNQLSELQWQRMQNADKTLETFFFCNEERKDDLVRYPGGLFFSLGKRELFIAFSQGKVDYSQ